MHNFKELTGKFIVVTIYAKKEYLKVHIKGKDETFNVVKGMPDKPLENLIHSFFNERTPVLPIHIPS